MARAVFVYVVKWEGEGNSTGCVGNSSFHDFLLFSFRLLHLSFVYVGRNR